MTTNIAWVRLIVLAVLLVGCSGIAGPAGSSASSESGGIKISASASTTTLIIPAPTSTRPAVGSTPLAESPGLSWGTLSVTVQNTGRNEMQVDVWSDVLPGIHFVADPRQGLSKDGRTATRAGLAMRSAESRTVDFVYALDSPVDPGVYVIEVHAKTSASDVVTTTMKIDVVRTGQN